MVRPASRSIPESWQGHPQVKIVRGDLRSPQGIAELLEGVDCVVHLAASKSGSLYEQFGGTVIATENLLNAMVEADVGRLVAISSFSVYEYLKRHSGGVLDETSPLAADPYIRDEYCQTKLEQERLIFEQEEAHNLRCVVLRPGVIFGRDNLWTARLGMQINDRWWIRTGSSAALPLSYVENCAEVVILAAEYDGPERKLVLNVVDGETPSQREYLKALQARMTPRPRIVPVPWTVMRFLAYLAWQVNRICFKGTAKVPGLFVPSRLHARCKPLRYSNKKIISALGWNPRYSWQEGVERSLNKTEEIDLPIPKENKVTSQSPPAGKSE